MRSCEPQSPPAFYAATLDLLLRSGIPFLVGGAYAFERYTGIARDTKDLDVFVHPRDARAVLDVFARAGYRAELTYPHWLGKVHGEEAVLDVIFGSGNGCVPVDDAWFTRAVPGEVLERRVLLSPPEEMIRSKAFIMERERFDGADVLHLLHATAERLDWEWLVARFGVHWRVLLAHLVLFGYVYAGERDRMPAAVMSRLLRRLDREAASPGPDRRICAGTMLSRAQYLVDVDGRGYRDARVCLGSMSGEEIAAWTAAIDGEPPRDSAA